MSEYLSAQEAADELGVNLATLYAYVSRRMIRSEAVGGSKRTRRYNATDVQRLKDRKDQRQHPEKIAETALHFGTPLIDSAITLIADGRLYYRGLDATMLAQNHTIEQVAALIWTGDIDVEISTFSDSSFGVLPPRCQVVLPYLQDLTTFERFQALLPLIAVDDLAAYGRSISEIVQTGARILRYMTAIAANQDSVGIVEALVPDDPHAAKLVNAALILCADHELNVSAFTARCVASAESTPYDAVIAGLSALKGAKHGGNTELVERLFQDVRALGNVRTALASYLKGNLTDFIPGFGHPLYPAGDPRGRTLLDMVRQAYPDLEVVIRAESIEKAVFDLKGQHANLDFALVTLANALRLPRGGAMTLFALGRTIGWIGHIIEQYETGQLIRPRARYTGQSPTTES
jgi:citrate synthase